MNAHDIKHPCLNPAVRHIYGRVHLPVAPRCNVQCNFCSRRFDCVNESRPGVTSTLLSPESALHYLDEILQRRPNITVAGIAGPGDPFANPKETLETLRLIREKHPTLFLCISTNGLDVLDYIEELAHLKVGSVTLTVNGIDPTLLAKIYSWIHYKGKTLKGLEATEILHQNQFNAIRALKAKGIFVKVNTVLIPTINDLHIVDIAKAVASLGADLLNIIPLIPTAETVFETLPEPSKADVADIRKQAEHYLPQMSHCQRCRADAVGLLGESSCKDDFDRLDRFSDKKRYLAIASLSGFTVDLHLGEASQFLIYKNGEKGPQLVEVRLAPDPNLAGRWQKTAALLSDCCAVISVGAGGTPQQVLATHGIESLFMPVNIEQAVKAIFGQGKIDHLVDKKAGCGPDCSGGRIGCK